MDDETFTKFQAWKKSRRVIVPPPISESVVTPDFYVSVNNKDTKDDDHDTKKLVDDAASISSEPEKQKRSYPPLPTQVSHKEEHSDTGFGPLIKPIIYGGMDGLVSVFVGALIAAITGEPLTVILSLTLAKLFAGAFSMGAGEYMSSRAEVDFAVGERKREEWECENFKEGEVKEMVELYQSKGYSEATANRIVEILSKNDKVFVDAMMVEELEIPLDQADQSPVKNMIVNFLSFLFFGTVPVLPFIVFIIGRAATCGSGAACVGSTWNSSYIPLYISIGVSTAALIFLSLFKAKVTGLKYLVSLAQAFIGALLSVGFGAGLGYAIYYATGAAV